MRKDVVNRCNQHGLPLSVWNGMIRRANAERVGPGRLTMVAWPPRDGRCTAGAEQFDTTTGEAYPGSGTTGAIGPRKVAPEAVWSHLVASTKRVRDLSTRRKNSESGGELAIVGGWLEA